MREKVLEQIKECKDVLPSRIINGYYVKTIFSEIITRKEVRINVLAVFENESSKEILQYNVDVENLFGTLFDSNAYRPTEIDEVVDKVLYWLDFANRR